nr:Hok/Gef family protein [Vibrio maritimus]
MPRNKMALLGLMVICMTILCFTWMARGSLCELHFKDGYSVISATFAYESR